MVFAVFLNAALVSKKELKNITFWGQKDFVLMGNIRNVSIDLSTSRLKMYEGKVIIFSPFYITSSFCSSCSVQQCLFLPVSP